MQLSNFLPLVIWSGCSLARSLSPSPSQDVLPIHFTSRLPKSITPRSNILLSWETAKGAGGGAVAISSAKPASPGLSLLLLNMADTSKSLRLTGDHRVREEGEYEWEVPTYGYGVPGRPGDRFRLTLYDGEWRAVARSTEFVITPESLDEKIEGKDLEL